MSERVFRELPQIDPKLVEALKKLHDENEQLTGAYIRPEHVVVDTTGLKFENLARTPDLASAHLGHHYGPVHPDIMPYTPVEKGSK